jgi:hypothetical protein
MTSTTGADPAVLQVLAAYLSCEFATVSKAGVPIAWPTIPYVDPDTGRITVTTSIGFPAKARNVRREPRVSLLFSDPTGSGAASRPQVLVRGTAVCPDEVVTSVEGREDYWRRVYRCQPAGKMYGANAAARYFFDWYYFRLVLTITPETVEVREPATFPGFMASARVAGGPIADVGRELPHYRSAVLSWVDGEGAARSARVRATAGTEILRLEIPDGEPLQSGPASLLCHSHDEQLWRLRSFASTGELVWSPDGWLFRPVRFLPGASPRVPALIRMMRDARATAGRYLAARGLERPDVPWDDYKRLYRDAVGR